MKGEINGSRRTRSGVNSRSLLLGLVLAGFLGVSPAVPQALPNWSLPTGPSSTSMWIRSVQTVGNAPAGTAVRYIAANSVSGAVGAANAAVKARGVLNIVPVAMRSGLAASAIRTVCVERRACLVALGVTGALSTIGVLANIGSNGLPEERPLPSGDVDMSLLSRPEGSYVDMGKNAPGNGPTGDTVTIRPHADAEAWYCTQTFSTGVNKGLCRRYTILVEGVYEVPGPGTNRTDSNGLTWYPDTAPANMGGCMNFKHMAGNYIYPDQWCSPATQIKCEQDKCMPSRNNKNYAKDEFELGRIILDPDSVPITSDQGKRAFEMTNGETLVLGQSESGRRVYESIWDFLDLSEGSYATAQEVISEGLDKWGATDPAGNVIGNPLPGWNPSLGQNVANPQTPPNIITDPDKLEDPGIDPGANPEPGEGGNTNPNIPQPPYDVRVINVDDSIADVGGSWLPTDISLPTSFDFGSRWLSSSCPSPENIDIGGYGSVSFDYTPICTGLDFFSYLLIASTLLWAGLFVTRNAVA